MMEDSYMETADTSAACPPPAAQEGSKLPPVLANLMVSMNSNRSPQAQSSTPPPNNPSVNVQELLSSIMVCFPDFSAFSRLLLASFLGSLTFFFYLTYF